MFNLIRHSVTDAPDWIKKSGYLKTLIDFEARAKKRKAEWAPHHRHCCEAIEAAAAECVDWRRAVVLGSGLLYDIPLKRLSDTFEEVVLVDIFHMPSAQEQAAQYKNVKLMREDITGVAEDLFLKPPTPGNAVLPQPLFRLPEDLTRQVDLTVSANILSHLPQLPVKWLTEGRRFAAAVLDNFARDMIKAHLSQLEHAPGVVCMIAETTRLEIIDGRSVGEDDLLYGIDLPLADRPDVTWTWTWDLYPKPDLHRNRDVVHKVQGMILKG